MATYHDIKNPRWLSAGKFCDSSTVSGLNGDGRAARSSVSNALNSYIGVFAYLIEQAS